MSKSIFHLSLKETEYDLKASGNEFAEFFAHGSLVVELYKPGKADKQTPHTRDEVYIVVSGSGRFYNDGAYADFAKGDFLFAKAGAVHRFEDYTDDFMTWVLFYGPHGGEKT